MAPLHTAFVVPAPGGPAVTAVIQTRYANAVQQDILLVTSARTSGQNMFRVQLYGPIERGTASQKRLREGFLPISNVGTEMRQLFPGVRMVRSPYYVQNRYGPFGYAAGRSASGDTCLYGWQGLNSTGRTQTWTGNKGAIQLRLRVCDQTASEQQLLKLMYDFTITASFMDGNWNPYGAPNSPDAELGKSGSPIYPIGETQFATVTSPPPRPPARRSAPPRRQPPVAEAPVLPPPIGPVVPSPPVANNASVARPPINAAPAAQGEDVVVPPPPCVPAAGQVCR